MDKWGIATKVFVGSWVVLGLIFVLKVVTAITGVYAVDWSEEARFWGFLLVTSVGFLAVLAGRSSTRRG